MLPFLNKQKAQTGLIIAERRPDEKEPESQEDSGLMSAAKDLLSAIESKDHTAIAMAIKAAFTILDSEPHEEGPHTNETKQE